MARSWRAFLFGVFLASVWLMGPSSASGAYPLQTAAARLELIIIDAETEQPTPARVRLVDEAGRSVPLPDEAVAVMYGHWDHADGYGYQPDSSFYVPGAFRLELPAGTYHLSLSKGNEYVAQQHDITLESGQELSKTFELERWIDTPEMGWYSADDHIHVRRSPREDPLLMDWIQAEDVHVGVFLRMGDFWETYYPQYAWGEKGVYTEGDYLLTSGQEDPRTPELGHALGIGAEDRARFKDEYYYYDKVFDRLHELGGMTGYAHQASTFHGYRGLMLDGLRQKVDVLELMQFCAPEGPLITDHYYHMLDLGYEITATAGSDFPWCGKDHRYGEEVAFEKAAQIGNARFYTYTDGPLTYASWKAGLDAGHTFATTGPILILDVNGHLPGDRVDVGTGDVVRVTARAYGHREQVPLERLEIVGHGQVLAQVSTADAGQSTEHLTLELALPVERGIWLAARTFAGPHQSAHTTPVYVTLAGGGFHNPETALEYLTLAEHYLDEIEQELAEPSDDVERQAWRYAEGLQARIDETRAVIEALRQRLR